MKRKSENVYDYGLDSAVIAYSPRTGQGRSLQVAYKKFREISIFKKIFTMEVSRFPGGRRGNTIPPEAPSKVSIEWGGSIINVLIVLPRTPTPLAPTLHMESNVILKQHLSSG